jgi:hypothetical protein
MAAWASAAVVPEGPEWSRPGAARPAREQPAGPGRAGTPGLLAPTARTPRLPRNPLYNTVPFPHRLQQLTNVYGFTVQVLRAASSGSPLACEQLADSVPRVLQHLPRLAVLATMAGGPPRLPGPAHQLTDL